MWKHIVANFLTVLIVLLVAVGGGIAWAKRSYQGPGPLTEAVCLQVAPGSSLRKVADDLVEKGAIRSAYLFRTGADYEGRAGDVKFGSFLIRPGESMSGIVDTITAGGPSTCGAEVLMRIGVRANQLVLREVDPATGQIVERIRINPATETAPEALSEAITGADARLRIAMAEGVTSWQVVQALNAADFLKGEIKATPPEGSLSPDTYEVAQGADRAALIADMTARQTRNLQAAWDARAEGLPYKTPEEALIMASLVEKETGVPTERRQVAGVFVNRLEKGMKLQTDPAVIYGVTKGEGILDRGLRRSELTTRTPYNTYVIDGLPPTPIANPGRAAIEAALNPDPTDYLYFVADGTGGHAFATTLEQHNANVARWRQIEAEQARQQQGMTGGN
ncbi:endolytic transglycosylase MltG [Paracoccus sp. p4-l81]|uniref:endolytic transglycosylase MltG n=1 Tax=unclassified Paracoccus (in: a-proteobacteria) TaxID=2688777 RepID=UPI0035B72781